MSALNHLAPVSPGSDPARFSCSVPQIKAISCRVELVSGKSAHIDVTENGVFLRALVAIDNKLRVEAPGPITMSDPHFEADVQRTVRSLCFSSGV